MDCEQQAQFLWKKINYTEIKNSESNLKTTHRRRRSAILKYVNNYLGGSERAAEYQKSMRSMNHAKFILTISMYSNMFIEKEKLFFGHLIGPQQEVFDPHTHS